MAQLDQLDLNLHADYKHIPSESDMRVGRGGRLPRRIIAGAMERGDRKRSTDVKEVDIESKYREAFIRSDVKHDGRK